jgi:hypothetical protein
VPWESGGISGVQSRLVEGGTVAVVVTAATGRLEDLQELQRRVGVCLYVDGSTVPQYLFDVGVDQ